MTRPDPACAVAHGETRPDVTDRRLVAVFASPVARYAMAAPAATSSETVR
ncbi:hypothetical protein [Actinomadura miaoliensis]